MGARDPSPCTICMHCMLDLALRLFFLFSMISTVINVTSNIWGKAYVIASAGGIGEDSETHFQDLPVTPALRFGAASWTCTGNRVY